MARWESKTGTQCTRKQLPLTMAFGVTIHKSQGLTLEQVVVDLGPRDFSNGLAYVAISRVKRLEGLAFYAPFGMERLQRKDSPSLTRLRVDTSRRERLG